MEIADSISTVRTPAFHGPDARIVNMEIACWRLTVRTRKALCENYLQRTCDRPDDSVSPSGRGSQTGKIFSENLRNSGRIVVRPDGAHIFYSSCTFEPQPINRGPWALRTARIRHWIPSELRELFCEVIGADLSLKPLQVCCCCATTEVYLKGRP
jgi:hypothetical protein